MKYAGLMKTYVMASPSGVITQFTCMSKFSEANNLRSPLLYLVYRGERNHHYGWKQCFQCLKPTAFFNVQGEPEETEAQKLHKLFMRV